MFYNRIKFRLVTITAPVLVEYYKNMSLTSKYHKVVGPLQGLGFKLTLTVYAEVKN